ncbi:MAG TPA: hypothetical protein VEX88_15480 [Glaciibacter sp.]|nr:hypothetical protein [Glaciibacter sp.]
MTYEGPLWRVFRTRGRHRVAWNDFRGYGSQVMAMYAGTDALTPFAEVFGRSRMIDPSARSGWHLAGWTPTRQLTLLDLAHSGAVLPSADIRRTEPWPQFTSTDFGAGIDGVLGSSRRGAGSVIILFESSAGALPHVPGYHQPLASTPAVVAAAAIRLGYGIRNY